MAQIYFSLSGDRLYSTMWHVASQLARSQERIVTESSEWVLFLDPPSPNASYLRLFSYDLRQQHDTVFNNGLYRLDSSHNFSLQVTDFTVYSSSLQKRVVYFRCTVDTFGQEQSYSNHTTTGVTFAFGM